MKASRYYLPCAAPDTSFWHNDVHTSRWIAQPRQHSWFKCDSNGDQDNEPSESVVEQRGQYPDKQYIHSDDETSVETGCNNYATLSKLCFWVKGENNAPILCVGMDIDLWKQAGHDFDTAFTETNGKRKAFGFFQDSKSYCQLIQRSDHHPNVTYTSLGENEDNNMPTWLQNIVQQKYNHWENWPCRSIKC